MTKTSLQRFDLAISLLRTLGQVTEAGWRLVGSEILGNGRSLLLWLGPVEEGHVRPVLIPVHSNRRRP